MWIFNARYSYFPRFFLQPRDLCINQRRSPSPIALKFAGVLDLASHITRPTAATSALSDPVPRTASPQSVFESDRKKPSPITNTRRATHSVLYHADTPHPIESHALAGGRWHPCPRYFTLGPSRVTPGQPASPQIAMLDAHFLALPRGCLDNPRV